MYKKVLAYATVTALVLSSCSSTIPQVPEGASSDNKNPAVNAPVVKAQWFWQGKWWEVNGNINAESRGKIVETPWIESRARELYAISHSGETAQLDLNNAKQQWNSATGLQTVAVPFTGTRADSVMVVTIRPTFFVFGAHTQDIVGVSFLRFNNTTQVRRPVRLQSSIGAGRSPFSVEVVSVRTDSSIGRASSYIIDPSNNNQFLSAAHTDQNPNNVQLTAILAPTFSSQRVNPCATINPPADCGTDEKPKLFPIYVEKSGNFKTRIPSQYPSSDNPSFPETDLGKPNCAALAQAVSDAQRAHSAALDNYRAAGFSLTGCGLIIANVIFGTGACLSALYWLSSAEASYNLALDQLDRAVNAYEAAQCKKN